MKENLLEILKQAETGIIRIDEDNQLILIWFGGNSHGIHGYSLDENSQLEEISFWNICGRDKDDKVFPSAIIKSMKNHMKEGYYPY